MSEGEVKKAGSDVQYVSCDRRMKLSFRFKKSSMTMQDMVVGQDINNVVKRYTAAGFRTDDFKELADRVKADASKYLDVSNATDIREYEKMLQEARSNFEQTIPSEIRSQFDNDAIKFYEYAKDENNFKQLRNEFYDLRNHNAPSPDRMEEASRQLVVPHGADGSNQSSKKSGDGE